MSCRPRTGGLVKLTISRHVMQATYIFTTVEKTKKEAWITDGKYQSVTIHIVLSFAIFVFHNFRMVNTIILLR